MYMFDRLLILQTECHPGTYGPNCLQKCSGNCLNNSTCNRTNGTCDMGCGSGYTGDLCDKGLTGSIFFKESIKIQKKKNTIIGKLKIQRRIDR